MDTGGGAINYLADVQSGDNGVMAYPYFLPGYTAGTGFDNCSGTGSIDGGIFAISVLMSGNQTGTPAGAITVATPKVTSTSVKATWTASSATKGYVAALFLRDLEPLNLVQAYLLPSDVSAMTFKNLVPNTQYFVQVFGYNASGGSWNYVIFTTPKK